MGLEQIKVELLDWWPKLDRDGKSGDKGIALAAWASSFDKEKAENRGESEIFRAVTQIVDNVHDTPKERVWMEFFLSIPIFSERQFDKYRMVVQQQDFQIEYWHAPFGRDGITQNELSGRYRTLPERAYELPSDVKYILKDVNNLVVGEYSNLMECEYELYNRTLKSFPEEWRKKDHPRNPDYKRVREVMRGVLGTGYFTDMRIILNLNAFEHIINQRLAPDAQLESRYIARLMLEEAQKHQVANTAINEMMNKNQWLAWLEELKTYE